MEFSDSESTEDIFTPVSKSGLGALFQSGNPGPTGRSNLKYEAPNKKIIEDVPEPTINNTLQTVIGKLYDMSVLSAIVRL